MCAGWAADDARDAVTFGRTMRLLCAFLVLLVSVSWAADLCQDDGDDTLRCTVARLDGARINSTRPGAVRTLEVTCSDPSYLHPLLQLDFLRDFRELRSLSILGCVLESVHAGTFRQLRNLNDLTVRTFSTQWTSAELRLEPGSFSGVEQLESLD